MILCRPNQSQRRCIETLCDLQEPGPEIILLSPLCWHRASLESESHDSSVLYGDPVQALQSKSITQRRLIPRSTRQGLFALMSKGRDTIRGVVVAGILVYPSLMVVGLHYPWTPS